MRHLPLGFGDLVKGHAVHTIGDPVLVSLIGVWFPIQAVPDCSTPLLAELDTPRVTEERRNGALPWPHWSGFEPIGTLLQVFCSRHDFLAISSEDEHVIGIGHHRPKLGRSQQGADNSFADDRRRGGTQREPHQTSEGSRHPTITGYNELIVRPTAYGVVPDHVLDHGRGQWPQQLRQTGCPHAAVEVDHVDLHRVRVAIPEGGFDGRKCHRHPTVEEILISPGRM